jgi:hypothetical protein
MELEQIATLTELHKPNKKCERCGVEIIGSCRLGRDNSWIHIDPLECMAYTLSKMWVVECFIVEELENIKGSMEQLVDLIGEEQE